MEFGFTYTDIFVTVISMCLAARMQQVTKRVKLACVKEVSIFQSQINDLKLAAKLQKNFLKYATLTKTANINH